MQRTQTLYTQSYAIRRDLKVNVLHSHLAQTSLTGHSALRSFTLESGQEEIERRNRRRKEHTHDELDILESRRGSADSLRSPTSGHQRAPTLSDVPEDGTFAVGDDEDDDTDDDNQPTPAESTPTEYPSRASSVSSSVDDAVPSQLRGMSEKARGKMPGKTPNCLTKSSAKN